MSYSKPDIEIEFNNKIVNIECEFIDGSKEIINNVKDICIDSDPIYDLFLVRAGENYEIDEPYILSKLKRIVIGDYVLTIDKKDV